MPPVPTAQVFYNNMLSLPFIALMMLVTGESRSIWSEPDLANPTFLAVAGVSGLIGFGIRLGEGQQCCRAGVAG